MSCYCDDILQHSLAFPLQAVSNDTANDVHSEYHGKMATSGSTPMPSRSLYRKARQTSKEFESVSETALNMIDIEQCPCAYLLVQADCFDVLSSNRTPSSITEAFAFFFQVGKYPEECLT